MKKHETAMLLTLALSTALLSTAGCGREEPPNGESASAPAQADRRSKEPTTAMLERGPELTFVTLEHDFGEIPDVAGGPHTCAFEFSNTGDRVLEIIDIKPSCGCTTAQLARREYGPGEGAAIEVTFDPKNRQGRQAKRIDIVTNAEQQGAVQLRISADVKPFVALEPRSVQFESVRLGESRTAIVEVWSADPGLVIDSIGNAGNHVGARLVPGALESRPPRQGEEEAPLYAIEITLDEGAPWGETNRTIAIECRGRIEGEEIAYSTHLGVKAFVFGQLRADPPSFRLGSVSPEGLVEQRIRLTSTSGAPFSLRDVRLERGNMPELDVRAEPIVDEDASGYELVLFGRTGAEAPKSIYGAVVVETDVPGEEHLEVPCYGLVRGPGP